MSSHGEVPVYALLLPKSRSMLNFLTQLPFDSLEQALVPFRTFPIAFHVMRRVPLCSFPPVSMPLSPTLHRMLADPSPQERDLLAVELDEDDAEHGIVQASFLNTLTGDLEARIVKVNKNTDQRLIIVTQDKVLLCLKRNLARLGRKEWIAPLSTASTILISLITADFRYALGLGSAEWRAIFIVSGFLSVFWLGHALYKAFHARTYQEVVRDIVYDLSARKRYLDLRS